MPSVNSLYINPYENDMKVKIIIIDNGIWTILNQVKYQIWSEWWNMKVKNMKIYKGISIFLRQVQGKVD